jgi:molybdenum cofactor cytidylyltransferase
LSDLLTALGLSRGDVVSIVGAGGKTTIALRLAAEAEARRLRVLVTATTHMGALPGDLRGRLRLEDEGEAADLETAGAGGGRIVVLGRRLRPDKIRGVAPERVDALARQVDLTIVEADGARGRSLKLPGEHEPVLPRSTTHVIVVAALDVIGAPLSDATVHRLALVLEATGAEEGSTIDADLVATALISPNGYTSRIPEAARPTLFLNKAEDPRRLRAAARIAARLSPHFGAVVAGSARGGPLVLWRRPRP